MIREYDDLTEQEQTHLANAWTQIVKGLAVYENITGAGSLDDMVNEAIWNEIKLQKQEEV